MGRRGWGREPPWGLREGRDEVHRHMRVHGAPATHMLASPTCHRAAQQPHSGRSVPSWTTAFRKSLPATSPCGSGAAWALPGFTWWGRGPSGNSGPPSQPAPRPPFLLRCPGSSGTSIWPSVCRGGCCPELRLAPCPIPLHRPPCSFLRGLSAWEPVARVSDSVSPDSASSELPGLREVRPGQPVLSS